MSYAGSVRGVGRSAGQIGGDNDHELRQGHIPDYVDATRSKLNSVIVRPSSGPELRERCNKLRGQRHTQRAMKSNACVAQSIMISFGHKIQDGFEALDIELQDELYLKLMQRIADEAKTEVSGLVAHRDETAPHAHGQFVGYNRDGVPLTKVMTRQFRKDMQDWMLEIFQPHIPAMERGVAKSIRLARGDDASKTLHRAVNELHKDIPREIEAKKAVRDELVAEVERFRRLAAKARTKAANDDLKAEKALKRAATYDRRAEAKMAAFKEVKSELTRLEETLQNMRNEEASLNEELERVDGEVADSLRQLHEIDTATAQKKTSIASLRQRKASLLAKLQNLNAA